MSRLVRSVFLFVYCLGMRGAKKSRYASLDGTRPRPTGRAAAKDAADRLVQKLVAECTSLIRLRRAVGGTFETLRAPYVASKRDDS